MLKAIGFVLTLLLVPVLIFAQVTPKEASILNYRMIGFSFPAKNKPQNYILEIASGNLNNEKQFKKNIIKTVHSKTNKVIAEVPWFGCQYTWRIVPEAEAKSQTGAVFFHFSTGTIPEVDTSKSRLRITTSAQQFKDAYIILDGTKVIYDMAGKPVWYLPLIEGKNIEPRDLKITSRGSLTFIQSDAWETTIDGSILWKAPNNGAISGENREYYHHEFTRLSNGHYMIYANENLFCTLRSNNTIKINFEDRTSVPKSVFGVLAEYDAAGNIVWQWKTSHYFEESDLKYYVSRNNRPIIDLFHENSFYFDEQNQIIYISVKYLNRIIKIKYPEGTVLNNYGELFNPGVSNADNHMFCDQHSIRPGQDGYIYLFNNNVCNPGSYPSVIKFKEPQTANEHLNKVWEYECASKEHGPEGYPSGGNVLELPDKSVFISTAGPDNKILIVKPDKTLIWGAAAERWSEPDNKWLPVPSYRASIILSKKDMEQLIWSASKK